MFNTVKVLTNEPLELLDTLASEGTYVILKLLRRTTHRVFSICSLDLWADVNSTGIGYMRDSFEAANSTEEWAQH